MWKWGSKNTTIGARVTAININPEAISQKLQALSEQMKTLDKDTDWFTTCFRWLGILQATSGDTVSLCHVGYASLTMGL